MPTEQRPDRLAVLIDADNAPAKIADALFEEIAKFGQANVRRIYGDFSDGHSKGWAAILAKHAIVPQQQFAYTKGKNASDITLVIDAMDLLHSARFDGFCLVSSDSDFTRLAQRMREQSVMVYGFGEQKTPQSFVQACNRFITIENLGRAETPPEEPASGTARTRMPPSKAIPLINTALEQLADDTGWVALGRVGQQLSVLRPDFDTRNYGSAKLGDLIRKTGAFETQTSEGSGVRIRAKATPPGSPKRAAAKGKSTG